MGVVECFSSPLIPYGIQWVKIRRNRGIFDRLLQKEDEIHPIKKEIIRNRKNFFFKLNSLFIFYSKIPPKIQFHFSMALDDLVLIIISLLNWQIPQQISWFGIRDSCSVWWIDFLFFFTLLYLTLSCFLVLSKITNELWIFHNLKLKLR